MREQLQKRLQALKTEYAAGQKALANLDAQQLSLRETLLRIGGAIQVLEEELRREPAQPSGALNTALNRPSDVALSPEDTPNAG